ASGLGSIWVDVPNNSTVVRIDPATNNIQATIPTGTFRPCGGFTIGPDAVWLSECADGPHLGRRDPISNTLGPTVDLGRAERGHDAGLATIGGAPWIAGDGGRADNGRIVRVDPATNTIDRTLVPGPPAFGGGAMLVDGDSVWLVDGYNNRLLRLPLSAFVS